MLKSPLQCCSSFALAVEAVAGLVPMDFDLGMGLAHLLDLLSRDVGVLAAEVEHERQWGCSPAYWLMPPP